MKMFQEKNLQKISWVLLKVLYWITSLVLSVIDEFAAMGGLHVTLSGGEALLHKDIAEICLLDMAKQK